MKHGKRLSDYHDRIKHTAEQVGSQVGALYQVESTVAASGAAEELVINVDGGHINTTEEGKIFQCQFFFFIVVVD